MARIVSIQKSTPIPLDDYLGKTQIIVDLAIFFSVVLWRDGSSNQK
jgi:hypothetical protein